MADEKKSSNVAGNGIRLAAEAFVAPGTSLLLDGKVGAGAIRVAVGLAARSVLGPAGWLLVAADSYTKSRTNKGLLERVVGRFKTAAPSPPTPSTDPG